MKKIITLILGLTITTLFAQRHEIGIFGGGANVIGDIGRSNYINPVPVSYNSPNPLSKIPIALGVVYRFNFNPYMGLRFNGIYSKVIGNDLVAPEFYKKERRYAYQNNIMETSIIFEYNFFNINNEQEFAHSPYIFAGVGAFFTNQNSYTVQHTFNRDTNGNIINPSNESDFRSTITSDKELTTNFTVPLGVGYKVKFKHNWVLSLETGFRATQTDNLDHSFSDQKQFSFEVEEGLNQSPYQNIIIERNKQVLSSRQVGNTSSTDWYVFTGLTLTYAFGRQPCYCD